MKSLKKIFIFVIIILTISMLALIISISRSNKPKDVGAEDIITVSILPIKFLVDAITGNSIKVEVLVPVGSSPESYEPVAQQIMKLENSKLIFTTGLLALEDVLVKRVAHGAVSRIINLSTGIKLLSGECASSSKEHTHAHGIDPHIWTSPKSLKIMAKNSYNAIIAVYPDSLHYRSNYKELISKLDKLDRDVAKMLRSHNVKSFLIYHPALTYYSSDYNIEQLSFEQEGKEPSVELMKLNIDRARASGAKKILYQREFSRTMVETIAKDIGVKIVEIDPLAENIIDNILFITDQIAQ